MRVVAVHSQKGGSAKTLLSLHIAVAAVAAGKKVAVIDIDPQCSATSWKDTRETELPMVISVQPSRLAKTLKVAEDDGADLIVIDTAPHSADAAIQAVEASDLMLIPCRPAVFDLRSLTNTARIVKIAGKPAYVVLSQAPLAPRLIEDARETVKQAGLDVAPVVIHQRAAYMHSTTVGMTATEWEPHSKAAGEIAELSKWLHNRINL